MFKTNKSKVKEICKANGLQLFERRDRAGYSIKILTEDGRYMYEAEAMYKNLAYERILNQMPIMQEWKRVV